MPTAPTYPGVYIEEVPSGVRTITGVATSVAAFLGYFSRGPMNEAVRIFNFGDFEREFGGLRADSEAAYAIQQFFLNGGSQAYVVRTASAVEEVDAFVTLRDDEGADILTLTARAPGVLGNGLSVEVDYNADDESTQFNVTISDGTTTETYENLSPGTAIDVINADLALVEASEPDTPPGTRPSQTGTTGGQLAETGLSISQEPFSVLLNGTVVGTVTWGSTAGTLLGVAGYLAARLNAIPELAAATVDTFDNRLRILPNTEGAEDVVTLQSEDGNILADLGLNADNAVANPQRFMLEDGEDTQPNAAAIDLQDAAGGSPVLRITAKNEGAWGNNLRVDIDHGVLDPNGDPDALFNLTISEIGLVNGRERVINQETYTNLVIDQSSRRNVVDVLDGSDLVDVALVGTPAVGTQPAQTGTISAPFGDGEINLPVTGNQTMQVSLNGGTPATVTLGAGPFASAPALASALQAALRPELGQATVEVLGSGSTRRFLRVKAGTDDPADILTFSDGAGDTLAGLLGVDDTARSNVQQYALGALTAAGAQALPDGLPEVGYDGGPPGANDLIGSQAEKTGMYALQDVDLINILCIPDTVRLSETAATQVAAAAIALCDAERAFYLLDVPQPPNPRDEPTEIQEWIDKHATLRHKNAALYYPRPQVADALNDFRLRAVASSGTMAGVFARTDATRGVWKAPAGTETGLRGVQRLGYRLTDSENGLLNPLAVNCLRTLPVFGRVAWGARTLDGADQHASEWKYIPVRRLTLFIEESLFRGLQWVVFEPNDEPLWSSIRLNVGAFMQTLFRQGAFQGSSAREAYFVKCDRETTTQNDINSGIVNVVVGFAPLKPAEFVIIKIQQMAGQIDT